MSSKEFDSQAYNKSIFITTHNSYRWSITDQLEKGVRGLELDIHDEWGITDTIKRWFGRKGNFKVGHWSAGHEVLREGGNPRGDNLEKWFGKIVEWSREKKGHAPITVFLDIKDCLCDHDNQPPEQFGLIRFNEQILNAFKDDQARLYTIGKFVEFYKEHHSWPIIKDLRDKIIVVLMSFHTFSSILPFMKPIMDTLGIHPLRTRLTYQEGSIADPICFVAFNPADCDKSGYKKSLEDKSFYVTLEKAFPLEKYSTYWDKNRILRADYIPERGFPNSVNFPATDNWEDTEYLNATDQWVR
ncbi:MAG: hypothetical protein ACFFB2_20315 [Promethearchaeota archaeon]